MPRRARLSLPGVPHHIIQRGNNRSACFYTEKDYQLYLDWLAEYSVETHCDIHAFVLMTNHVHLLLTPRDERGVGQLMKRLGQRFVQYINRTYKRSGTLWEGRFRSCLAHEERYVLSCYRYIELNPVRAGMVEHPAEYRWSSYRDNAQGETLTFITPHDLYTRLDRDAGQRLRVYRSLFRTELESEMVEQIRKATNGNYALGSGKFRHEVETALGRRASPGQPGRPRVKVNG